MKRIYSLIFLTALALAITACGTKRQYFEPSQINGKLDADESLSSKIVDTNLYFASLRNNKVLSIEGELNNFKLEKGYQLLLYKDNEFISADEDGNLRIFAEDGTELYSHKFNAAVLGVDTSGDDLALILADNTILVSNRSLGIKFSQTLSPAVATDSRVAAPLFLDTIIVFPSLDGKLNIVDRTNLYVIRSVVLSTDDFFNNIIYMNIVDNQMIAATGKKIVVVSPGRTYTLDEEIKNIAVSDNNIFIFAKNGNIIKSNLQLNKLKEKKFTFALYNDVSVFKDSVYIFEKTGYLIKLDYDLENEKIYELKDAKGEKTFMGDDKFYYNNKAINLP